MSIWQNDTSAARDTASDDQLKLIELMLLSKLKTKFTPAVLAVLGAPLFVGCNGFIHDDLPECNHDIRVKLSYTMNMDFEERIAEVPTAHIFIFDSKGMLAGEKTVTSAELVAADGVTSVTVPASGDYQIVVWGGLSEDSPFRLDGTRAVSTIEDVTCRLMYETTEQGHKVNKTHFPHLYHSLTPTTFQVSDVEQEIVLNELTKNTNTLTVTLHNRSDKPLKAGEYTFVVTDNNAVMGHDNSIKPEDTHVQYHATAVESGKRPVSDGQGGVSGTQAESVVATIPLARLMEDSAGYLYVYKGTEEIAKVSITELLLKCKQYEAPHMDNQEYLDRQDSYSISFFVNEGGYVIKSLVYVNDWEIITQDIDF